MKLNILIPMAGESSRFGYKFKPFLYLDNRRFIEHTLDSFIKYDNIINSYNFIITKQQENDLNIVYQLHNIFPLLTNKINVIIIPEKTKGPYQTILSSLLVEQCNSGINSPRFKDYNVIMENMNNIIICDCDHYVNIEPIINSIKVNDIIIPTWKISENEHMNWGKIVLMNKKVEKFVEKEYVHPKKNQEVFGIIGCYYFKNINLLIKNDNYINFTDFFQENFKNLNIHIVNINSAYFYGTPGMIKDALKYRRKFDNILCDIDGVLFKHNPHSNDLVEDNQILGDCVNKLIKWRKENKKIILMTARPKNTINTFINLLNEKNIIYDDIVMGLNPGTRYIINDIKPSIPFVKQTVSFNIQRDTGIDNILCNELDNHNIEIIKKFKGNSFCNTYLLKNKNGYFVRKYILKNSDTSLHVDKLKRQYQDLKRFYYYDKNLVPNLLNEKDSDFDYYFDIEYLPNHKQLDTYNKEIQHKVLDKLFDRLSNNVYCYKKKNDDVRFIDDYFKTKIYPKLLEFEKECPILNYLINSDEVIINNKKYYGLRKIFEILDIHNFNTEWINPIHGDLTLENILYDEINNDIKLIDMDGSRYVDSCYFDLGKIFQSIVTNYSEWNILDNIIYDKNINNIKCIDKYFDCENSEYDTICNLFGKIMGVKDKNIIFKKGIFFMTTYFIRFVQFRRQVSDDHGIFAIIMAVVWLNKILRI